MFHPTYVFVNQVSSECYRKLEEVERERAKDMESLREQHRLACLTLKRESEEALGRLAEAKNQEINMVASAHDTSRSLTAVVEQIQVGGTGSSLVWVPPKNIIQINQKIKM